MSKINLKALILGAVAGIVGGYLLAPIVFIMWAGGSIARDYRLDMYEVARFFGLTDRYFISYAVAFVVVFVIVLGIARLISKPRRTE